MEYKIVGVYKDLHHNNGT